MRAIFQRKSKKEQKMLKRSKKGKTFKNLDENVRSLETF